MDEIEKKEVYQNVISNLDFIAETLNEEHDGEVEFQVSSSITSQKEVITKSRVEIVMVYNNE